MPTYGSIIRVLVLVSSYWAGPFHFRQFHFSSTLTKGQQARFHPKLRCGMMAETTYSNLKYSLLKVVGENCQGPSNPDRSV